MYHENNIDVSATRSSSLPFQYQGTSPVQIMWKSWCYMEHSQHSSLEITVKITIALTQMY